MATGDRHDRADTLGKRLAVLLFSTVFALAFGLGGYFAGLQPLGQTLRAVLEVRGWQPVAAQVLGSELKRHTSSDGTTYRVQARYRYAFGGRQYEGTRVGLDPEGGTDNIGDWHQRWHGVLQSAQSRGQSITVMVNPQAPSQALIDPSIRWAMQLFRLPFALVFTGVGLVAGWVFLHTLLRLGKGKEESGEDGASRTPRLKSPNGTSAGAAWFFTLFWCGIAFPMAGMLWSSASAPWYAKAFISVFVMVGLGLGAFSVRQTYLAWRYAGAALSVLPERPRAGHPVEITLRLPERAAACQQGHTPQLRLAQYRVDESSSGSPERCVESFTEAARLQPTADGGLWLVACFAVPADAPPHGAQRSGERVDWRLELLHGPGGPAQLTYDLPVQAAPRTFESGDELPDRFDRRAAWKQVTPIAPLSEQGEEDGGTLPLPPSVTLQETPQAWQYGFSQSSWRWAAGLVLAGLALEAAINGRLGALGLALPRGFFSAGAWIALVAFALHAATRRWTLTVQDSGITARRHSWLWSRADTVRGDASRTLAHKLLYATGSGASRRRYHAVYARGAGDTLVRLTPGLGGVAAATALGQSLAQAWAHRRGRFAAGLQRPVRAQHSRPAWGALLVAMLLVWWVVGPKVRGATHRTSATELPGPAVPYSTAGGRLLAAQNAGGAAALRAVLPQAPTPTCSRPTARAC